MGIKVNYNKKKTNKLKIAGIAILSLFVAVLLVVSFKKALEDPEIKEYVSNDKSSLNVYTEFNTLEEIFEAYGSKVISENETDELLSATVDFKYNLYTGDKSNENFFVRLCNAVSVFANFKNIELIDKEKDINIQISCDGNRIVEMKINGELNYYLTHDSEKNKNLSQSVTNFTIQSPELKQLIDGNWDESKVEWGTKDSTCDGYNIYFDEGINYKNVSRNVFNVIFTEKYKGQIAENLSVNSTLEEVERKLGEPTFQRGELYGYLGENNYLFFDFINKEISVYPVVKITEDDEKKLKELIEDMNRTSDVKTFASELTSLWIDYDVYDFDSYYVDLKYTLKGVSLSIDSSSLKNGIYIYQNYSGNRNISELENVYIKDTDFVFDKECERNIDESLNRTDEGDFTEEERIAMGTKFAVRSKSISDTNHLVGVYLYSRDKSLPDVELARNLEVSSWKWYDDYNFIYSVDYDGIYVYNCLLKTNTKLESINKEIKINEISNNKIIYNEDKEIQINVN